MTGECGKCGYNGPHGHSCDPKMRAEMQPVSLSFEEVEALDTLFSQWNFQNSIPALHSVVDKVRMRVADAKEYIQRYPVTDDC